MAIVNPERDAIESIIDILRRNAHTTIKVWPKELPSNQWRFLLQDSARRDPQEMALCGISEPRETNYPERVAIFGEHPGESYQRPDIWRDDVETCGIAVLVRPTTKEEARRIGLRMAIVRLEPLDRLRDAAIFKATDHIALYNPVI